MATLAALQTKLFRAQLDSLSDSWWTRNDAYLSAQQILISAKYVRASDDERAQLMSDAQDIVDNFRRR